MWWCCSIWVGRSWAIRDTKSRHLFLQSLLGPSTEESTDWNYWSQLNVSRCTGQFSHEDSFHPEGVQKRYLLHYVMFQCHSFWRSSFLLPSSRCRHQRDDCKANKNSDNLPHFLEKWRFSFWYCSYLEVFPHVSVGCSENIMDNG